MQGELLDCDDAMELCGEIRKQGREVFLALPHIFRMNTEELFQKRYAKILNQEFDGVLVRNLESVQFLKKCGFDRTVILDHNLYVFNQYTKMFWQNYGVERFTLPLELNRQEIRKLGAENGELIIYGYLPVMISAQCITNTVSGCQKKERFVEMIDRLQNPFTVCNRCRECYNVIYNSTPLYLLDQEAELKELGCRSVRLQFSKEDGEETEQILKAYHNIFVENHQPEQFQEKFTRGHFKRGII